jgi:hypothetical protein
MRTATLNGVSGKVILILCLIALGTVFAGYFTPPHPDEGALAHIFQLSMVALAPALLIFLLTADWSQPRRMAQRLASRGALLAAAFAGLYFLEHR